MKNTLCVLLLLLAGSVYGQQYLYLQKGNDVPHTRLSLKDHVKFKTSDSTGWTSGILQSITTESITVGGVTYPLEEIKAFRTRNSLGYTIGSAAAAGGVFFSAIIMANGLISGERPIITNNQIILGAGLLTSGLLTRWLSLKTYNREDGWHWKVIDLEKDFEQ